MTERRKSITQRLSGSISNLFGKKKEEEEEFDITHEKFDSKEHLSDEEEDKNSTCNHQWRPYRVNLIFNLKLQRKFS
jgi:hypothetical protein